MKFSATLAARVQRVVLPDGERTWTVLGADHLPVGRSRSSWSIIG